MLSNGIHIGRRGGVRLTGGGGGVSTPVPTLGAELIVNGGFDSDTVWTKGANWSIGSGVAAHNGGASYITQNVLTSNRWYLAEYNCVTRVSGNHRISVGTTGNQLGTQAGTGLRRVTLWANGATAGIGAIDGTNNLSIDDVSFRQIDTASMFSAADFGLTHATVKAGVTLTDRDVVAGVVANLDNPSTPANFVIGFLYRTATTGTGARASLVKCVGGVYTMLVSYNTSVVYSAGAMLEIRRLASSNTYQLWYNGAQVGTNQTISDAGIVSNTLHGLFNTYAGNALSAFSATASA